jgi:hypothetical protein
MVLYRKPEALDGKRVEKSSGGMAAAEQTESAGAGSGA